MTLRRRLLLVFFGLAVVPVGALALLATLGSSRLALRRAEAALGETLGALGGLVERELRAERANLAVLIGRIEGSAGRQPEEVFAGQPEVQVRIGQPRGFVSRFIVLRRGADSAGVVAGRHAPHRVAVERSRLAAAALPRAYHERAARAESLAGRTFPLTVPRPTGAALAIVTPFAGPSPGVVVEELSALELLRACLAQPGFQALEGVAVTAGDATNGPPRILYHSDPSRIGLGLDDLGWPAAVTARLPGLDPGPGRDADGRRSGSDARAPAAGLRCAFARAGDRLFAAGREPVTDWTLAGSLSLAPFLEPSRSNLRFLFAMLGVLVALVAAGIVAVTRGVGGAVEEIAAGASAIARGQFDRTIRVARTDEFAAIAAALNLMARELAITAESRSIARVSARLAHDLKGVASQMNLLLHNLRDHYDDPEFRDEFAGLMKGLVTRVESLVLELRRGGEEPPARLEAVDLNALVADLVESSLRASWPDVTLERALEARRTSRVDPALVREVVENLVANAAEAMGGRGRLAVRCGDRPATAGADGGKRTHFIEFADGGPGMTREFVERDLFRPFATTKPKGLGLGMYQVRRAVDRLGGRIQVDSRPGHGTRIRVELGAPPDPAARAAPPDAPPAGG